MPQNNDLLYFVEKFPDELSCRKYLENQLWKNGPVCPHCKHKKVYKYKDGRLYKCASKTCRKQFQVTTGTIYQDSNIKLRKWFLALYLISTHKKGISSVQLGKQLGITQRAAWYMAHKIRYMLQNKTAFRPLSNVVEVDETYVGGKFKGGKRGRGSENKTPVFGMLERKGKLIIMVVPNTRRVTLQPIILQNVAKGTQIMSDEWWAYTKLSSHGYKHGVVKHKAKEYVRGDIHSNSLEGAWSLLKRSIRGIYHRPSREHLDKYCAEFQFKYNTRNDTEITRFTKTVAKSRISVKYSNITKNIAKNNSYLSTNEKEVQIQKGKRGNRNSN
ncbi:MAG: family transposase [Bacteroidetes bacterium]|nr:family transposase [Bacteroidota bacterium]